MRISIPESLVNEQVQLVRAQQEILDKIAAIPGVSAAGLSSTIPMTGDAWQDPIFAQDRVYAESQIPPVRRFKFVSPGLLKQWATA